MRLLVPQVLGALLRLARSSQPRTSLCHCHTAQGHQMSTSQPAVEVDAAIVGAGVVGLAVAKALAERGQNVIVLETADAIGTESSSRNSEVIHSGLYYPPGSLKARLCMEGKQQMYQYCQERNIPHKRLGKLLVAVSHDQLDKLRSLKENGEANGITDLRWLEGEEAMEMEPALHCIAAVHSPSTGIADIEEQGGSVALSTSITAGHVAGGLHHLTLSSGKGGERRHLTAKLLVNAAGLWATKVASLLQDLPVAHIPKQHYARGVYFTMAEKAPFKHLIYPMPEAAGLGTHLTLDLNGYARFGPDVEWVDDVDYTVDPSRSKSFYPAIQHYWPGLKDGALKADYAGIRPKLSAPGEPSRDFLIQGPGEHGVEGLVNLFGIESPGLTSSLAIGHHVADMLLNPDALKGSEGAQGSRDQAAQAYVD